MPESKHVLTSKLFLTGAVTVVSGIIMMAFDQFGVNIDISLTLQGGIVTVVGSLVAWWRTRPTKPVYIVKQKVRSSDIAKDRKIIDRGNVNEEV